MPQENSNGSIVGVLRTVPAKAVLWGVLVLAALVSGAYAKSYVTRLESVEVKVEKIDKMANDIEWIKKYLESNRR